MSSGKKSVEISLELNDKNPSSGGSRKEKREELKGDVAIDLPTSKPHEVIYGKVRLTLAGDVWIAKPKKRGKISKKINATAEKVGESSVSALMEAGVRWIMNKFPDHWTYTSLYLVLLGFVSGVIGAAIDFVSGNLGIWRSYIISNPSSPGITGFGEADWREIFVEYILWILWSISFVLVGMVITRKIGPGAIGSGIPELKSILSGVYLSEYLSLRTLFAKIVGTTIATSSGLSIGKEGPLVHAGAIVANQLSRFTIFERIRKNPMLLQQMLTASAASGIAANLGCPIGGVLFAIEITSTYYPVRNYWFSFLGAMVAAVTYRGVFNYRFGKPWLTSIAPTYFENLNFTVVELLVSFILGIICALLGVLFLRIFIHWKTFWTRATKGKRIVESPYFYAFILALMSGTVTYPKFFGKFMALDPLTHIQEMFVNDDLRTTNLTRAPDWGKYNLYGSLTAGFLFRYIFSAITVWIPVPGGLWLPLMAAGAMLGRIVGEILRIVLVHFPGQGNESVEGLFAVIGAGSLLGAVTHSLSICVVIFEITGQITFLLPVMLSLVTSYGISRKLSTYSLYEIIARDRKLPFLPDIIEDNVESTAREIMSTKFMFITSEFDKDDVETALQELEYRTIPVVLNRETMLITGTVDRDTLLDYFGPKEVTSGESPRLIKSQTVIDLPGSTPGKVPVSSLPIQISEDTPLSQIHMLFINLRLFHAFVTSNGKLVGVISRAALKGAVENHNRRFTLLD